MFAEYTEKVHSEVYSAVDPKTILKGALKGKNVIVTGTSEM
jgi:hypothetical protein